VNIPGLHIGGLTLTLMIVESTSSLVPPRDLRTLLEHTSSITFIEVEEDMLSIEGRTELAPVEEEET